MATIANLSIAVTINAGNSTAQLRALTVQVQSFGSAFNSSLTSSITMGNLWSRAISGIFSAAQQNFSTFVTNAIKYSQQFNNALVGLSSVSNAFGVDAGAATAAAKALSNDGLLPLRDSAAGLKNLLMTGFGLQDSIKIMNVFKDSAVYARQGFLSYGDAIRTATEGLKNSQSRLVDNVGITKNLSVIMKEYGYQLQDISDKTKGHAARQVLMNGLMREAAAMAGDAARSLGTYTGAVTAVDTAWISLQAEVGNAITTNKSVQVVLTMVAESLRDVTKWLTTTSKGSYAVSDALVFLLGYLRVTIVVLDLTQQGLSWLAIKALEGAKSIVDFAVKSVQAIKFLIVALSSLPGGAKALEAIGVSTDQFHDKLEAWRGTQDDLAQSIKTLKEGSATLSGVFKTATERVDSWIGAAKANRGLLVDIGQAGRQAGDGMDAAAGGIDRAGKKAKEKLDTFRELAAAITDVGDTAGFAKAIAAISAKLPAFKKGMEGTRDAMFGFKEIKDAYEMVAAIGGLAHVSDLTADQQKELHEAVGKAMDAFRALGITADKELTDIYNESERLPKIMEELHGNLEAISHDLDKLIAPDFMADMKVGDITDLFDWDQVTQNAKIMVAEITDEIDKMQASIKPDLFGWFQDLPNVIRDAMARGDSIFEALGRSAGASFSKSFAEHVALALKANRSLTGGEKALGLAGMGIEAFFGGFDIGQSQGKAKGALGGAATGAMSGAMMGSVIPGIGTLVGGVIGGAAGFFGGLFGGSKKAKEERAELEKNKKALLDQYGGMAKLQKLAQSLGVDITKAFNAKTPEQFKAVIDQLNTALAEQKKRIEGLNTALKGVNDRAAIFADKFSKLYEAANKPAAGDKFTKEEAAARADATQKLQAQAQASEGEFARLGLMIRDTFAGLVKETGSGITALQQMAPAFQMLEDGVTKWGLTSTAVIDELRENFNLVNNEAFKPLFEQIAASGAVLQGLFDAKALSPAGFQAIAADIGASIQGIIDKGGDAAKTLALSQPVLQTLWEAQQQYGLVTDETTQAILEQAKQQGLVGEHMKDVNQKILDVLLAIGEVLGATLPEYFDKLKGPAEDAASSIEDSFSDIQIDPIRIPYTYDATNELPEGVGVPHLATGGIVTRRTLAVVGESGPEAVIPLSGANLGVSPASYETTIYLDGEVLARSAAKRIPKIMRGLGVGH